MPTFHLIAEELVDPDHFAHYSCVPTTADGLGSELADVVRGLYVDESELSTVLHEATVGLGQIADDDAIQQLVDEVIGAVVPPGQAPVNPERTPVPAQLELTRNELGEVIAHLAAEEVFGTIVPTKRIRHKDVPGRPSRGMDLLGVDPDPMTLVLGEAKTSTSETSPPAVVGDGDDSLRSQLAGYMVDRARVIRELYWALDHAPPNHVATVGRALLLYLKRELNVVVFAALVRPGSLASPTDFGSFRHDPAQFRPAAIRFCIISLEDPIAELARDAYDGARRPA